jgi:predicted RNA-binding protein with TRAM domain
VLSNPEDTLNNYNNNICNTCNLTIHPNFIGYHKCGYANCPICKNAITNSQYWYHVQDMRMIAILYQGKNLKSEENTGEVMAWTVVIVVLEAGKEYEVEIAKISRQGDGIARVQGFVVFVKSGKVGQNVKVQVEQVGNRYATATMTS